MPSSDIPKDDGFPEDAGPMASADPKTEVGRPIPPAITDSASHPWEDWNPPSEAAGQVSLPDVKGGESPTAQWPDESDGSTMDGPSPNPAESATVFQPLPPQFWATPPLIQGAPPPLVGQSRPVPPSEAVAAAYPETIFAPAPPRGQDPAAVSPRAAAPSPQRPAKRTSGRIEPGVRLNNSYEVKAFIAKGGMGEVYEGANIITNEQLAIKVILPELAHNELVVDMFHKEARTLINLKHPALVQYRTVAQDPQLDVLYIVTEFIPGPNLGDMLGQIEPTQETIIRLTRRLCEGLHHAHAGGAVHRDMSPDNVLLRNGILDEATIIDFGIAKSLDTNVKTSIGDGFGGKLSYAAPEQMGLFNREIGPWTDIYSTALVILAFANRRPLNMGGLAADAVEIRRKPIDVSFLPPALQPVFARMLTPDPTKRFQSMDQVLKALPAIDETDLSYKPVKPGIVAFVQGLFARPPATMFGLPRSVVLGVGGGLSVIVIGLLGLTVIPSLDGPPVPAVSTAPTGQTAGSAASGGVNGNADPATPQLPPSELVRRRTEAAARAMACSWLDIESASVTNDSVEVRVIGVAGDLAAASKAVSDATEVGAGGNAKTNTSEVFPIRSEMCAALDAMRAVRVQTPFGERAVEPEKHTFEIVSQRTEKCRAQMASVIVTIKAPPGDFAVLGFSGDGTGQVIAASRGEMENFVRERPKNFARVGDTGYRLTLCTSEPGLSGIVLVQGSPPFTTGLKSLIDRSPVDTMADSSWATRFAASAAAQGWKTDGAWFRVLSQ